MKKLSTITLLAFTLFVSGSAIAKNKRYELQLSQTVQASGVELKPGTYQLEMDGNSLVFYQGKKEIGKVSVRSEEEQKKIEATSVTVAQEQLKSIELGGTKTKLIVE
jgi:hypothetical protein